MRSFVVVALFLWFVALVALASGTINTTEGTIIDSGDGLNEGTVIVDECYEEGGPPPEIPSPSMEGSLGTITGAMPGFNGGGTGVDGIFSAPSSISLSSGTYNFTTYTVDFESVVAYNGPVTIRTTGDVVLRGTVMVPNGGGVTFLCGGDFTLEGADAGTTNRRITTAGGSILIDCAGRVSLGNSTSGTRALLTTPSGGITIRGRLDDVVVNNHDDPVEFSDTASVSIANTLINSSGGTLLVQGGESVELTGPLTDLSAGSGVSESFLTLQAFGGPLLATDGVTIDAQMFSGELRMEAATDVLLQATSVSTSNVDCFTGAFGGGILLRDSYMEIGGVDDLVGVGDGSLELAASGFVEMESSTVVTQNGDIRISAFSGDVGIEPPGHFGSSTVRSNNGDVRVQASGSVDLSGNVTLQSDSGSVRTDALAGGISFNGSQTTFNAGRDCILRGEPGITAESFVSFYINTGSADVAAGSDGIEIENFYVDSVIGGTSIVAEGDITTDGTIGGSGFLDILSRDGDLQLAFLTARTATNGPFDPTGAVRIMTWKSDGFINLSSGNVQSGSADEGDSGDVTVAVVASGDPPPVDSYFLPKKVTVKLNGAKPEKSSVTVAGFLDVGSGPVDLSNGGTLSVGDLDIPFEGLESNGSGSLFQLKADGLVFRIKPSKTGSSKAAFQLKRKGDLSEASIDPDGVLDLFFANGDIEAAGSVGLTAGKYALGKKRGALFAPNLFLAKGKAALKGGGKDALTLVAGLATNGTTPSSAPDFRLEFLDLDLEVSGGEFTASGDRFTFKGDGFTVILDYLKETITVKAKGTDLGPLPEGPGGSVDVRIGLDGVTREVRVRMGIKKTNLTY